MLFWKLKGIMYILGQNHSLLKGNYFKEIQSYFRTCCFERNVLLQMKCRILWVWKIAHHVSFKAIETYLHKNIVYPLYIMGNKGKKASFRKACTSISMLHGQLMYRNTRLVISSTERQHTIISDVHKGLRHDPKAKVMASHCGRDSTI